MHARPKSPQRTLFRKVSTGFVNAAGKSFSLVALFIQIGRERHALARLSDAELRDIGISRENANRESKRSVFDIPMNRLRRRPVLSGRCAGEDAVRESVTRYP